MSIVLTEKAAEAVKGEIGRALEADKTHDKIYLRVRVVGGGCSGFQNKLDLDPQMNPKLDDVFELNGVPVVVDRRSQMYLDGAVVDFHDEFNRKGFSISNPQAKSTCGCGSSFTV